MDEILRAREQRQVLWHVKGRLHKSEHSRVAAYPRVVICVSLRMAASAEAPSSPMLLAAILQARGRMGLVRE